MSNLLDALYSNAWSITDGKLRDIEAMLQRHALGESLPESKAQKIAQANATDVFEGLSSFETDESGRYLRSGGTAYVPIHGTIVSRAGLIARASGAVSPQTVQENIRRAAQDESVDRIVLDVDSPGGTINGTMPTANTVKQVASSDKRVVAVAENTMASAAYWISVMADEVVVGKSAMVGSVGVMAIHRDKTEKLEEEGIESTVIRVQGDKALGHPEEEFSEEAREMWEDRLQGYYDLFVKAVAGSMNVSENELREEIGSRAYMGRDAVEAGLADRTGTLASVIQSSIFEPTDTQTTMPQSNDESAEEGEKSDGQDIEARLSELEEQLAAEQERADEAEERAEKAEEKARRATEVAENLSEEVASQKRESLKEKATDLVDNEIIGRGKAHASQRESLLQQCKEGTEFDADRIELVRNMYAGLAEGSAVPVENTDRDKGSEREEPGSPESDEIRDDLVSNLPSRYNGSIE